MLAIKYIRDHIGEVRENIVNRKAKVDLHDLLLLDDKRKELQALLDTARQELNAASKSKPTPEQIVELRSLGESIKTQEEALKEVQLQLDTQMSWMPNMSSPDMPIGKGEDSSARAWSRTTPRSLAPCGLHDH